ncbi:MAG: hypothetical protein NQU46_07350 [Methanolinea sp.]|nr:hypothetical protein [Methanolinea sp.]
MGPIRASRITPAVAGFISLAVLAVGTLLGGMRGRDDLPAGKGNVPSRSGSPLPYLSLLLFLRHRR